MIFSWRSKQNKKQKLQYQITKMHFKDINNNDVDEYIELDVFDDVENNNDNDPNENNNIEALGCK